MKARNIGHILSIVLTLVALCGFGRADRPAPNFTAQTLDGERIGNASMSGRYVLVQFWATWCPYCRKDQPAVDNIQRRFSDQGLLVLAVNDGESEGAVRDYLRQHPRSCRVALDEGKVISRRFGKHGVPYYVLINREGRIAGTQDGAGGEQSLVSLLNRGGLYLHSNSQQASNPNPANPENSTTPADPDAPRPPSGAKVIEVPRETKPVVVKPIPKTVFVLANGERLESDHFTLDARTVRVMVDGRVRTISLGALDMKATLTANHERGLDLKIPARGGELLIAP